MGFRSTEGQNLRFPIDFAGRRYNSAASTTQSTVLDNVHQLKRFQKSTNLTLKNKILYILGAKLDLWPPYWIKAKFNVAQKNFNK